jgi:hypothetical protein
MNYEMEDRIQAAMLYFGMWLEENGIKLPTKVPMSLINTKYGVKIRESLGLKKWCSITTIGDKVLEKGIVVLDDFRPDEKFTDKNQKIIDKLIPKDLPFGSMLSVREDDPHELFITLNLPTEPLLLSNLTKDQYYDLRDTPSVLKDKLKKFLGIEEGNLLHGDFNFYTSTNLQGLDEWVKMFSKKVKPEIKKIDGGNKIRAIKLQVNPRNSSPVEMIVYTHRNVRGLSELKRQVIEILSEKFGYNINLFNISVR